MDGKCLLHMTSLGYQLTASKSHGVVSDLATAERWTSQRALGDVFNFAIELKEDDSTPIPIIGLAGSFRGGEIGYMIHPGSQTISSWTSCTLR